MISDENHTPKYIIDLVYRVLDTIDLDPASSFEANQMIGASKIYTKQQNGLVQSWYGKVFLNPPYSKQLITQFINKLIFEYENSFVYEAILIVNNTTDTKNGQRLLAKYPVCFLPRINFYNPYKKQAGNRYAQMIFYLGNNIDKFDSVFSEIGIVMEKIK